MTMDDRYDTPPSLDTLFAQAGGAIDPRTGGIVPPLETATTFVRDELLDPSEPLVCDDELDIHITVARAD